MQRLRIDVWLVTDRGLATCGKDGISVFWITVFPRAIPSLVLRRSCHQPAIPGHALSQQYPGPQVHFTFGAGYDGFFGSNHADKFQSAR